MFDSVSGSIAMFSYRIDKFQGIIFSIASGTITKADVIDLHKKFQ
jgi:hypothetical protein